MKEKYTDRQRVIIFLIITFAITFILEFGVMFSRVGTSGINTDPVSGVLYYAVMFLPTIGVVLTRLITGEGFDNHHLGINLKEGRIKYYVCAWTAPFFLTILGAVLYFVIFPDSFDPNVSYLMRSFDGTTLDVSAVRATLISQSVTSLVLGPVMNCIFTFGEEWAWRGYLLYKLKDKMSPVSLMLLTGTIWGLWHLPLIVMGHNYGFGYSLYPITGILMMCLFCIVFGIFLSFVTLKADSCVPAIIGHGALNGIASVGIYFTFDGGKMLFGPSPCGLIGMIPLAIVSALILYKVRDFN